MKRKYERLLGSHRSRYFREKRASPRKFSFKRSQRVRFRSRYAGSLLREWGEFLWKTTQVAVLTGVLGFTIVAAVRFWQNSSHIRVKEIVFEQDIPAQLRSSFPLRSGQNLILIRPWRLEREWLQKYPELKSLSIHRRFDRRVAVSGRFRVPVARLVKSPGAWGIDDESRVFPVGELKTSLVNLPWVGAAHENEIPELIGALSTWKKTAPAFYSLVNKIETDNMRDVTVGLIDNVMVRWGEWNARATEARTKNLVRLLELYEPKKTPASLKFVTDDRIVMDANWMSKSGHKKN